VDEVLEVVLELPDIGDLAARTGRAVPADVGSEHGVPGAREAARERMHAGAAR
jgi:hypothetical protein